MVDELGHGVVVEPALRVGIVLVGGGEVAREVGGKVGERRPRPGEHPGLPDDSAFMEQLETEYACACGDAKRACAALLRGDAAGLFDRAWLEQCPMLVSIRETNEYATVARHVAARAEAVAAAYVMT